MPKALLFLKSDPAVPILGADISMFERIAMLNKLGWNGSILSVAPLSSREGLHKVLQNLNLKFTSEEDNTLFLYQFKGVASTIRFSNDPAEVFEKYAKAILLLGNLRDMAVADYITNSDQPHLFFLTENEFPKPGMPGADQYGELLSRAKHIAVASSFLADSLQEHWGIKAHLFKNTIELDSLDGVVSDKHGFISLMHPYGYKGVDLFLNLARSLPQCKFLLAAGVGAEYRNRKSEFLSHHNVTLHPFTTNVAEIYSKSRLVLVPSMWQEGFSRVIVEALSCGIPVLHSDRGGMIEAAGGAAIEVPIKCAENGAVTNLNDWIEAINQLDDDKLYQKYSELGKARAKRYTAELQASLTGLDYLLTHLSQSKD